MAVGWFGDRPWLNVTKTYSACLLGTGLATVMMPAAVPYPAALVASASFFGLFVASNFSFTPTILVELVPLDRFTTAYGLTLLCQGVGTLIGPPLAGLYILIYLHLHKYITLFFLFMYLCQGSRFYNLNENVIVKFKLYNSYEKKL